MKTINEGYGEGKKKLAVQKMFHLPGQILI